MELRLPGIVLRLVEMLLGLRESALELAWWDGFRTCAIAYTAVIVIVLALRSR